MIDVIILSMKDVEIEIQVRISKKSKLMDFLANKAEYKGEKYQKDEYFIPQHRNFLDKKPVLEWLRLRESKSNSITYKNWHHDKSGKSNYCDEYETDIVDVEQMRKIFKALDIKPVITVEKTRKIWIYKDYEISIDYITDLGDFVEIEYKSNDINIDPKKITDEMVQLLKRIDCGKIERNYVGYPFMILYPDEAIFDEV